MLTWSLGCTWVPVRRDARAAMTSLAFMLVLVPEPVWNTSTGKCASWRPPATSRAAAAMARAARTGSRPSPRFASAAQALMSPRAPKNGRGRRVPPSGKFSTALWVCAPKRARAGTRTGPMLSVSMR